MRAASYALPGPDDLDGLEARLTARIEAVLGELQVLRAAVERLERPSATRLSAADRAVLAVLLPAAFGAFSSAAFRARDLEGLVDITSRGGLTCPRLGHLLRHAHGHTAGGCVLSQLPRKSGRRLYTIRRVGVLPPLMSA